MNIKIKIYLFLITLLSLSCNNEILQDVHYYESGEVEYRKVYNNPEDYELKESFIQYHYFKNGNLKKVFEVKDSLLNNTLCEYYENGKQKRTINYSNGKKNGIEKLYTKENEIAESNFYINSFHMVQMKSFNNAGGTAEFYYYIEPDTIIEMGLLLYSEDNQLIKNRSFYYTLDCKDTINYNESQKFELIIYTENFESKIEEFFLGEFNENYDFIDSSKVVGLSSETNRLTYEFLPEKNGYNVIMGKAYVSTEINSDAGNETLKREFIVYKDFFVKE